MKQTTNDVLSKISKLTIKDKQGELIQIVLSICHRVIEIIDNKLAETKPEIIEYEYIDILVEAFFSIRSFCLLMKEGLVSSAAAIIRVALEQASIVTLAYKDEETKQSFLKVKKERSTYYFKKGEFQKQYLDELDQKFGIKKRKIKQYFDYGWYLDNGQPVLNFKTICKEAGFEEAYELVDSIINAFAHGQLSIFRFSRHKNGLDTSFIGRLFSILGKVFFKLANILLRDYGSSIFNDADRSTIDMAFAISQDLDARLYEGDTLYSINSGMVKLSNLDKNISSLMELSIRHDSAIDFRERYFLSQAFIHYYRLLIAAVVCYLYKPINDMKFDCLNLATIFATRDISELLNDYSSQEAVDFKKLTDFIDSCGCEWYCHQGDIEYIKSANILLTILEKKYKNNR